MTRPWLAVALAIGGCTTKETDPVFSASPAATETSQEIADWNQAYAKTVANDGGFLTHETDPLFSASPAATVTASEIQSWNTAYSWGDPADAGYLTHETDPVFSASPAAAITSPLISQWNGAVSAIGPVTAGKWCQGADGGQIRCTADLPSTMTLSQLTLNTVGGNGGGETTYVFDGSMLNEATDTHTLFTLNTYSSALLDVTVLVYDVNSNTSQYFFHDEEAWVRSYTMAPVQTVLVTHYNKGVSLAMTVQTAAGGVSGDDIQLLITQPSPGSANLVYKAIVKVLLAQ